MKIRPERPGDETAIAELVDEAFLLAEHRDGTEAAIVERLRAADALTLSLVAEEKTELIGHIAFSPVTIDAENCGWLGLGPIAVLPECQRRGVGAALILEGLAILRDLGARGCVLVGEPSYYGRFGFKADNRLTFPGPPVQYFQALSFRRDMPSGVVSYHPAFG